MTDGLMFPKPGKQKKRKKHKKSILHGKDGTCYLCMKLNGDYWPKKVLHRHHVYQGKNKSISEREGFTVYLCPEHHNNGPEAVHNNDVNARILKRDCQREYEKTHTREEFVKMIEEDFLTGEELKDLKVGDRVKFENVYEHDDTYISGKGIITGFGKLGLTDIVWIETEEYGKKGIVYEEVIKIKGTSEEG